MEAVPSIPMSLGAINIVMMSTSAVRRITDRGEGGRGSSCRWQCYSSRSGGSCRGRRGTVGCIR